MGKVRLVAWLATTGGSGWALLRGATWPTGEPAEALMAGVRVVAGVLAAYLFVATIGALARLRWLPSPALVRRLAAGAIGGGLLVLPVPAVAGGADGPPPSPPPVLRRVDPAPDAGPATPAADAPDAPVPGPAPDGEEVTVVAGDHLWAIAERVVAARLGRAPTDGEVAPYWRSLIDANRDRLATGDPDLIFPGQTFVLP
ncbi:MAG TPA: hypothetical protein VM262_03930 [Acidimicrobiales bacterium]|nr:hypothetical protein [Acidimicrobiales bacterium]